MGSGLSLSNPISPCMHLPPAVRLVYWGGRARLLLSTGTTDGAATGVVTAGDVAAELPDAHAVCPADAFFVGLPVPAMSPGEEHLPGRTYFVLPAARLPPGLKALTPAALAALSSHSHSPASASASASANSNGKSRKPLLLFGDQKCPFEYVKGGGSGGAPLIRVLPEFIEKLITCDTPKAPKAAELCSTPELKRHYAQLVGARTSRPWSPRLETIAECDRRRWMRSAARTLLLSSR